MKIGYKMNRIFLIGLAILMLSTTSVYATDADNNGLIDEHEGITAYYGGATCAMCHAVEAKAALSSTHYLWKGPNGMGKANIMNTFCTNPAGSPMGSGILTLPDGVTQVAAGGGCMMCHVGAGMVQMSLLGTGSAKDGSTFADPDVDIMNSEVTNIDCLICHGGSGYNRISNFQGDELDPTATPGLTGDFANNPMACMDRDRYLGNVGYPNFCNDTTGSIPCTGTEQPCFYDTSPGQVSFDDKIVMMDERMTMITPVPKDTALPMGTLGYNVPGCGPRAYDTELTGNLAPSGHPLNNPYAVSIAQQVVGKPSVEACGRCHAGSGGGKNSKRADMEMTVVFASTINRDHDVHLGGSWDSKIGDKIKADPSVSNYWDSRTGNILCVDCHSSSALQGTMEFKGRAMDMVAGVDRVYCDDCHTDSPHEAFKPEFDRHATFIACQVCHITEVAKFESTEIVREWMDETLVPYASTVTLQDPLGAMFGGIAYDARHLGSNGIWHEYQERQTNLGPAFGIEYMWWNGDVNYAQLSDTITLSSNILETNTPLGTRTTGKVYPVKKQTTQLFLYNDNMVPITVGAVFQGWGIENALRFGAMRGGMDPDGSLVTPVMMFDPAFRMLCANDPTYNGCATQADQMAAMGAAYGIVTPMTEPMPVGVQEASRVVSLNHEVGTVDTALECRNCHNVKDGTYAGFDSANFYELLGYTKSESAILNTLYNDVSDVLTDPERTTDVPVLPAIGLALLGGSMAVIAIRRMRDN